MFDYDDINLIPNKCIVKSRSECDTAIKIGNHWFKMPIVPANMEAVIDEKLATKLALNNQFYIMHRFNTDNLKFIHDMKSAELVSSVSIGVSDADFQFIETIHLSPEMRPDFITIDIAHGHSDRVERMIKTIKDNGIESFVIAGNVSSPDACYEMSRIWNADMLKVGIGPGSACTTWNATGFGSRNMQAYFVKECAESASVPIIADGGIKHHGDIAKSLVLGASVVMIGGMLSGFLDSPGTMVEHEGQFFREFWGSASEFQSNKKDRIEGKKYLVELKNRTVLDEYVKIKESLQSAISYAGGKDLSAFSNVEFVTR